MSDPVDELFGAGSTPPPAPTDRLRGLVYLLVGSMVVNFVCPVVLGWELIRVRIAGTPDWGAVVLLLTVPGALATLWVWQRAGEERERSESSGDELGRRRASWLRGAAFSGLLFCLTSMLLQGWVLGGMIAQAEGPTG